MGELQPDDLDIDTRPLWQSDPKLWNKLSPALKKQFTPKGQSPPTGPVSELSPQAQAEKEAIYQDHLYLTPSQVEALDMEAYKRWSELGSHMKPEPLTPEQEAEQTRLAEARSAELQLLENADDDTYRQIRAEQDALYAQQPHEVITH